MAAVVAVSAAMLHWSAPASSKPADPAPTTWQQVGATVDGRHAGFPAVLAGRVTALAVLTGNPPTVVAGTNLGIWRRAGSGPWVDSTSVSWPSTAVSSIAPDPVATQVLYAGTGTDDVTVQPGTGGR
jgi:hypothetical protein